MLKFALQWSIFSHESSSYQAHVILIITCIRPSIFFPVGTENVIDVSFGGTRMCVSTQISQIVYTVEFSRGPELALTVIFSDDTRHDKLV